MLLIDPGFRGVNRLFVLSFENSGDRTSHTRYYLLKVKINIIINGRNFFDQPIKYYIKTYDHIRKTC